MLLSEICLCNQSAVLSCRFTATTTYVEIEDFDPDTNMFSHISAIRFGKMADFQEMKGPGEYNLSIMNIRMYNGSLYRCHGFDEQVLDVYSNNFSIVQIDGECCEFNINPVHLIKMCFLYNCAPI